MASILQINNNSDIHHSKFGCKRKLSSIIDENDISPIITTTNTTSTISPTATPQKEILSKDNIEEATGLSPMKKITLFKEWDWKSASIKAFSQDNLKFMDSSPTKKKTTTSINNNNQNSVNKSLDFLKTLYKGPSSSINSSGSSTNTTLPVKVELEQTIIDAGQKNVGQMICSKCKMLYAYGSKDDEAAHKQFCQSIKLQKVYIKNWSSFKVVNRFPNDHKIIVVTKEEELENSNNIKGKLSTIYNILNQELGTSSATGKKDHQNDTNSSAEKEEEKILLYLDSSNRVLGCIISERISQGFKIIDDDDDNNNNNNENENQVDSKDKIIQCSKTPSKVLCGINKIWTLSTSRNKGIARKLIDSLKSVMYYGYRLNNNEIAITQPTISGKLFFTKYFNTKNLILYNIANNSTTTTTK